jgi:hypothetical protein
MSLGPEGKQGARLRKGTLPSARVLESADRNDNNRWQALACNY